MTTKRDLKTWDAVVAYAATRAKRSLKRKDPVAWAYWVETEIFARKAAASYAHAGSWQMGAFDCVGKAKQSIQAGRFMEAALWYSRAKWFVIVARANGMVMDPKKTGVNLAWLKAVKIPHRAAATA